ncbi:MAG: clostripain-related cysteine peptidase [Clostridia bacterium]|nr:clostripain-related cysteine peptidase [Clostridia bacterium]
MLKRWLRLLAVALALPLACAATPAVRAEDARSVLTLMVYVTGSDLESAAGAATADIAEMARSGVDTDAVSVVLCTGGSKRWQAAFPSDEVCYYRLDGRRPAQLERVGAASMGAPDTLCRFLNYACGQFPAQQYALILWDHGGGPMEGVCFDELNDRDSLSLSELDQALARSPFGAGETLEWIGFDACLMSAVETAHTCAPYARYMIASQETEPGEGWDYSFLGDLLPGMNGADAGRAIIDRFVAQGTPESLQTLSCVDLSGLEAVESAMDALFADLDDRLNADSFSEISNDRQSTKGFGRAATGSDYDLVDLYHLAERCRDESPAASDALQSALEAAVVHCDGNQPDSHGLSIYYPYYNKKYYAEKWGSSAASGEIAPAYGRFLSDYAGFWLGEQLARWDGLQADAATQADACEVSLTLTEEQLAHFAYAQLLIISESAYTENFYKLDVIDGIRPEADGTLRAVYDYSSLYAVDADGEPLTDAIPYRIVEDTYMLRANFMNRSYDDYSAEWMGYDGREFHANEDAQIDVRKVYLRCRENDAGDGLDVLGVIDLTQEIGDGIQGIFYEGSELIMGKQVLTMDAGDWPYVEFVRFPVRREFGPEGETLPFDTWTNSEGLWESYDVDNTEPWSLRFLNRQYSGFNLYAQYVVWDTQGNAFASDLLPIDNPNLSSSYPVDVPVAEGPRFSLSLNRLEVLDAASDSGLRLRFFFDARPNEGETPFFFIELSDISLDGQVLPLTTGESIFHEGRQEVLFDLPPELFGDLADGEVNRLTARVTVTDYCGEAEAESEEYEGALSIEGSFDLSAIHTQSAQRTLWAESESDGVAWRLYDLAEDADGRLTFHLGAENRTDEDVLLEWDDMLMGGVTVNGLKWEGVDFSAEPVTLAPGSSAIVPVSFYRSSAPEDGLFNWTNTRQVDWPAYWGQEAIETLRFSAGTLEPAFVLTEPFPLAPSDSPAPTRFPLLDSQAVRVELTGFEWVEDAFHAIIDVYNPSEDSVYLELLSASVDGEEPYWSWDAAYDLLGFGAWTEYMLEPGECFHTLLGLSVEPDIPISELEFTFAFDPGDGSKARFTSRVTLPEPATPLALSDTAYPMERLGVTNGAA